MDGKNENSSNHSMWELGSSFIWQFFKESAELCTYCVHSWARGAPRRCCQKLHQVLAFQASCHLAGQDWARQKAGGTCSSLITSGTWLVLWLMWGQAVERQADRWGYFLPHWSRLPSRGPAPCKAPHVCVRASERCNRGLSLSSLFHWLVSALTPIFVRLELALEVLGEAHLLSQGSEGVMGL